MQHQLFHRKPGARQGASAGCEKTLRPSAERPHPIDPHAYLNLLHFLQAWVLRGQNGQPAAGQVSSPNPQDTTKTPFAG